MSDVVVYENPDGTVGIIAPASGVSASSQVGLVPSGRPSAIADASTLPTGDRPSWRISGDLSGTFSVAKDTAALLEIQRASMVVSRFQARAAMSAAGILGTVETAVTTAGGQTLLAWNEAVEFRRASPTIAALKSAVSLTDEQIDALFIAAAGIEA